ncbi:integrase [Ciceribacter azotifigens]|uniref:integrase n=1 Tax=Ciceribacter azotifigens TaxID=2069303 RepID=UPI003A83999C
MPEKATTTTKDTPTRDDRLRAASALDPHTAPSSSEPDAAPDIPGEPASSHTRRAYASDWKHFAAWCRREAAPPLPADPQLVARYIRACASGEGRKEGRANSASTIERRLSSLTWNYARRGFALPRQDDAITNALADARRSAGPPAPRQEMLTPGDLASMLETLDRGSLKGLRDRAILLLGFAGRLTRSEITGLDAGPGESVDGRGWVTFGPQGVTVTLTGKGGQRQVEIAHASADHSCPVTALGTWMRLGRIATGPVFRRVLRGGKIVGKDRLHDQEVARLVKRAALAAGLETGGTETSPAGVFSSRSLHLK